MIKTLQKHGNSQALPIDRATLDVLGIDMNTPLQVVIDGDSLIITPVNVGLGAEIVNKSLRKIRRRHGQTLKRLAE